MPDADSSRERTTLLVASAGYLGYAPVAPGTFGTLAGIPLYWAFDAMRAGSVGLYVAALTVFIVGSCWVADEADRLLGGHDSGKIVIDEVAGYLVATAFLPFTFQNVVAAFLFFRILDVLKPFPAGLIDRKVAGGPGVVLDDVVSGFYANLLVRALLSWT